MVVAEGDIHHRVKGQVVIQSCLVWLASADDDRPLLYRSRAEYGYLWLQNHRCLEQAPGGAVVCERESAFLQVGRFESTLPAALR